jgi:death-on-curing protein
MTEPEWLPLTVILAIHEEQLAQHGGAEGLRDAGVLESAIARPRNLLAYGSPDLIELAASLAFGIVKGHAFIDGNKRTAFVTMAVFLALNGIELTATDAEKVVAMQDLAAGDLPEAGFAAWLRDSTAPRG